MNSRRPTIWQLSTAQQFYIPAEQAHTINPKKAHEYFAYCRTHKCRLEWFLNNLENWRMVEAQKEWL